MKVKGKKQNKNFNDSFPFCEKLFAAHFISIFLAIPIMMVVAKFSDESELLTIAFLILFLSLNPGVFMLFPIFNRIKDKKKAMIIEKMWHISAFLIFIIIILWCLIKPLICYLDDGYYSYENMVYYNYGEYWYYYSQDMETWKEYTGKDHNFKYLGKDYKEDYQVLEFNSDDITN